MIYFLIDKGVIMKRKLRLRKWVILLLIGILLIGVIYYSYQIFLWKYQVIENSKIQKDIQELIEYPKNSKESYWIDFKSLKKINPDTVGYIKVNNTNIEYIVVQGKNNSYYLSHNFEKKWNRAGWVFADYRNQLDETDKNIILYAHDTKDGSMFETLKNVLKEEWYKNPENHEIIFITEQNTYHYKVFSSYSVIPEEYYIQTNFNKESFSSFVKELKKRSIYDYQTEVTGNDKIITLSSCLNEGKKRVVLHAKLLEEKEK